MLSSHFKDTAHRIPEPIYQLGSKHILCNNDMNEMENSHDLRINSMVSKQCAFYLPLKTPIENRLLPQIQALKATYILLLHKYQRLIIVSSWTDIYSIQLSLPFRDEWNNVKQQVVIIKKKDYLTKKMLKRVLTKSDYLQRGNKRNYKAQTNFHIWLQD